MIISFNIACTIYRGTMYSGVQKYWVENILNIQYTLNHENSYPTQFVFKYLT